MTLAYWRREAIEVEVVNLLRDYGVTTYPIDISELIEQIGIPIVPYENASPDERTLFNLASKDAFSVSDPSFTSSKILINSSVKPATRKPFNLGHELGHMWLEHSEEDPLRETEADYFSGYILAPHPLIARFKLLESGLAEAFDIGSWCADIACAQALERIRRGPSKPLPHEQWLLDNITFERRRP